MVWGSWGVGGLGSLGFLAFLRDESVGTKGQPRVAEW